MEDGVEPTASDRSVDTLRRADLTAGELEASLRMVVEATATIFEADGAGVMLLDDEQALHYVGATNSRAAALESAQELTGEGPCIDSILNDEVVHTGDLMTDDRWPLLREQLDESGIRAILGVPLRLGPAAVGSLNVYRHEPWTWKSGDIRAIEAHGSVVEQLLGSAMLAQRRSTIVEQLTNALQHRVTIERAIGILMARRDLDAVRAFNELRLEARSRRMRVADLASAVLAERELPPPSAVGPLR